MSHAAPEAAAVAAAASSGSASDQRIPSSLLERRHFSTKSNRESEQKEQVVRPRVEPKFSSPEDRSVHSRSASRPGSSLGSFPRGKLLLPESQVYAAAKLAAAQVAHGCKHFPSQYSDVGSAGIAKLGASGPSREFVTGGKTVNNRAQHISSRETSIEETFGRITRLSEEELHARNEHGALLGVEYGRDFYKQGACVPAVSMALSRGAKTAFGFAGLDLKAKRTSENLWKQTRRASTEVDASKLKTYKEVAAERELHYEQRLVEDLPDEVKPPVEDFAPAMEAPPPVKEETKREKRLREKKQKATA